MSHEFIFHPYEQRSKCFTIHQKITKEEFEDIKGIRSEFVNRRTDNTMAKKKRDKRTNNNLQNIHIKLMIENHESH